MTSSGHNLASDSTCVLSATGDKSSVDPKLGPLADNGGPTKTHALLPGSPVFDAGSPNCPPPPATDQRGVARPQGQVCDIGAFELVPPPRVPGSITVTKTGDTAGACTATDCSLREALRFAVSGDKIVVPAGIYTLTLGRELTIKVNLTLDGAGSGDAIIQSGGQLWRRNPSGVHRRNRRHGQYLRG